MSCLYFPWLLTRSMLLKQNACLPGKPQGAVALDSHVCSNGLAIRFLTMHISRFFFFHFTANSPLKAKLCGFHLDQLIIYKILVIFAVYYHLYQIPYSKKGISAEILVFQVFFRIQVSLKFKSISLLILHSRKLHHFSYSTQLRNMPPLAFLTTRSKIQVYKIS